MANQTLIHYHVGWKPNGQQVGTKRGLSAGIGDQLRSLVLLRDHPDPRRLDLRASIRDPFERLWVRDFYLNTALNVIVLLDGSASMGYVGTVSRLKVATDFTAQLAIAAYRSGDAFGLFSANERLIKEATLPARLNKSAWLWVRQQVGKLKVSGNSAAGLLRAIPQLPKRRSLVFVVSDFRWQDGQYQQLLKGLTHHDVVPIMLQDPAEMTELPKRGIAAVKDVETGDTQFLWMRPALKEKLEAARSAHLTQVQAVSRRFGVLPFLVNGAFNAGLLNEYFMARHR
jgi:uncharacterized protein (DUF58 family)